MQLCERIIPEGVIRDVLRHLIRRVCQDGGHALPCGRRIYGSRVRAVPTHHAMLPAQPHVAKPSLRILGHLARAGVLLR